MLNYKVRARTQNFDILFVLKPTGKVVAEEAEGYGHVRDVLQGGGCRAPRSTAIIVGACHLDGEGFRTLLGAAGGHLSPSWVDLGEALVGFVGIVFRHPDPEVARNLATGWFN